MMITSVAEVAAVALSEVTPDGQGARLESWGTAWETNAVSCTTRCNHCTNNLFIAAWKTNAYHMLKAQNHFTTNLLHCVAVWKTNMLYHLS